MSEGAEQICQGNIRALARHLRALDDGRPGAAEIQRALITHAGKARTIGITGSPGAGKSTLTDQLIRAYRARGLKVAVLAVDPSSPFSGGAILGDRIRMEASHGDPNVFVRSVATRGVLGGLAASIRDMVDAIDAAGFEMIIVETVGVGQDEIDIVHLAQTNVVLSLPGTGDGIQAIKAGLLEIADIFVVNKADRPGADRVVKDLQFTLEFETRERGGWTVPILRTNSLSGEGVESLVDALEEHREQLVRTGEGQRRRDAYRRTSLREALRLAIGRRLNTVMESARGEAVMKAFLDGQQSAHDAANGLLDLLDTD